MDASTADGNNTAPDQAPDQTAALVKDVSVESFETDVIAASMTAPVVVDFWAEWCGPCKQLAPVLEKAVLATGGKVSMVKVDIDKNKMLASQLRIQSVPTVYAFFQGRPVDGFQGALPESEIKEFIARMVELAGDGGAGERQEASIDDHIKAGEEALGAGDIAAAAQFFGQAVQLEAGHVGGLVGLAKCQLAAGDHDQAKQTLELVPPEKQNHADLVSLKASIALSDEGSRGGDVAALTAKADADPANLDARFELANAYISQGNLEQAIDSLLGIIERDRDWNEAAARQKLLTVFDALGGGHPATARGRRRLSSVLFS